MQFTTKLTTVVVGLLAGTSMAQYDYGSVSSVENKATASSTGSSAASTGSSSSTGNAKVHVVKVGDENGGITFSSNDLQVAVGEYVQFQFYPKNHAVVQSNFAKPCVPISQSVPGTSGFFSGFMPVSAGASSHPVYTIQVKNTEPIWFYCPQGTHCQGGMVGAINAKRDGEKTLAKFTELAKAAPANIAPSGNSTSSAGSGSGVTPSGTSSSGSDSSSTTSGSVATASVNAASALVAGHGSTAGFLGLIVAAVAAFVAV